MISAQILRWTVRNASHSLSSPLKFRTRHLPSQCVDCRLLCSSTDQTSPQHSHELAGLSRQPVTELSLHSLMDMGFTESQAGQIYEAASGVRGGAAAKHALSTLMGLFVLGLNPSSVLKLLNKCPELYFIKDSQLQQRTNNLRKLG